MRKFTLVLVVVLGMALSFSAISLVILFATGTVKDLDEVQALLTGKMSNAKRISSPR